MSYTILSSDYTPNNRQIDILLDEDGGASFALHIKQGELCKENDLLPIYNQPRAEVIFSDDLSAILMIDTKRGGELDHYDQKYSVTLYAMNEYNRKLNGYTPIALNK